MHCIKTINTEHEYGTTRIFLLASITFFIVFCLSYISMSFRYGEVQNDRYFFIFVILFILVYPAHKLSHLLGLYNHRKNYEFSIKVKFTFIPVLHVRLTEQISKKQYIIALLLPLFVLNVPLLIAGFTSPQYAHYFSILLAYHTSICLLDILFVKTIYKAPKAAVIEETPKGYELLVPTMSTKS